MSDALTIKPKQRTDDVLDYDFLKELGIEQIQKLSGENWTDYNIHDPGITILENLCYATTELGYRARYSVNDLLAPKNEKDAEYIKDTLFDSSKILSTHPLTIFDYRKLLLDIVGVKNAIIIPSQKYSDYQGIYEITVELFTDVDDDASRQQIKNKIWTVLNSNRNLAEDFNEIKFIEADPIVFNIDIEITGEVDIDDLLTDVYSELVEYLSPTTTFMGLQEVLDLGHTSSDIFEGPLLNSGFILEDEMERIEVREEIYISDIIHFIMDIKGVSYVKNITAYNSEKVASDWVCKVADGKTPKLDFVNTKVQFFNIGKLIDDDIDNQFDAEKVLAKDAIRASHKRLKFIREEGIFRNLDNYYSVQHEFPEAYGIGEEGLLPSSPLQRKAQAKQLKAFLLFFEQILTNYFAQIAHLDHVFSISKINQTYFSQPIFDIPGIEYIYKPFFDHCFVNSIDMDDSHAVKAEWRIYKEEHSDEFCKILDTIVETESSYLNRRNRVLDHLLARFSIDISDYKFMLLHGAEKENALIKDKLTLLNNYIRISKNRGKAFINLPKNELNESPISGLEYRINILLGFNLSSLRYPRKDLEREFNVFEITDQNKDTLLAEDSSNNLDFVFENSEKTELTNQLFLYGAAKENYKISKIDNQSGEYKININNYTGEKVASIKNNFNTAESAKEYINITANKLKKITANSECFHIIERILLRPVDDMKYFRFTFLDDKGEPFFKLDEHLTFDEREDIITKIFIRGLDINNFGLAKEGVEQYKIFIKEDNGEAIMSSNSYFKSQDNANKAIIKLTSYFQDIAEGRIDRDKALLYFTKHYELFNLADDPYSFIVTVLIPSWPGMFQDDRYQSHIRNIIELEMPAHISPDIRWVDIFTMNRILGLYEDYLVLKRQTKHDIEILTEISEELFEFFCNH